MPSCLVLYNMQHFPLSTREAYIPSIIGDCPTNIATCKAKNLHAIFICSCCHQKLFINQVEEFSEIIKREIDAADPDIRAKCIDEEVSLDLREDVQISYLLLSLITS